MRTEENFNNVWMLECIKRLPPRIQSDLRHFPMPEDLLYGQAKSTFIYGEVATGKTIRAAFMLVQEMKYNYLNNLNNTNIFVSFTDLLSEIRETYDNTEKRESDVMRKYLNTDLLVIDDFMSTRPTEWVTDIIYHLMNHRYEYLKKTIITSNFSLTEIEKRIGDQRITSRINLMCEIEEKKSWK